MRQKIIVPTLLAVALVAAIVPVSVLAVSYLDIRKAVVEVDDNDLEAKLKTSASIPTSGAFGYGLLTGDTSDAGALITGVVVATTHGGVLDSEDQANAADPVWHNHFVNLAVETGGICDPNTNLAAFGSPALEVSAITFQSPGEVEVKGKSLEFDNIPFTLAGTLPPVLGGGPVTITPGSDVSLAVSFTLDPKFNGPGGSLSNVCVENVAPVGVTLEQDD
jgi:hypothetical protein